MMILRHFSKVGSCSWKQTAVEVMLSRGKMSISVSSELKQSGGYQGNKAHLTCSSLQGIMGNYLASEWFGSASDAHSHMEGCGTFGLGKLV